MATITLVDTDSAQSLGNKQLSSTSDVSAAAGVDGDPLNAGGGLPPTTGSAGGVMYDDGTTRDWSANPRTSSVGVLAAARGTVTQATSKSTGVTLDAITGDITLNGAQLNGGSTVSFVLTNAKIGANDVIVINHVSVGTFGSYTFNARPAAGSATIDVRNAGSGNLSQAIVIRFFVLKVG